MRGNLQLRWLTLSCLLKLQDILGVYYNFKQVKNDRPGHIMKSLPFMIQLLTNCDKECFYDDEWYILPMTPVVTNWNEAQILQNVSNLLPLILA